VLDTLNLSMLVDGFLFQTPGTLGRLAEQGLLELVAETDEFIDFRCAGHDFLAGQLLTGRLDRARGNLPVQLHLRLADGVHTQEYRVLDALQIGSAFVPSHIVIAWYNGTVETFVQEIIATSWQATPDLPDAALHIELPDRSAAITDSVAGYYTELGPAGEVLQREALAAATGNEQPVVARAAGVPFISVGTISAATAVTILLVRRRRRVR
jgi:hypothetical protein